MCRLWPERLARSAESARSNAFGGLGDFQQRAPAHGFILSPFHARPNLCNHSPPMPFHSSSGELHSAASTPRAFGESPLLRSSSDVRLYVLAVVNEEGEVIREASAADARRAATQLHRSASVAAAEPAPAPSLQSLLAEYAQQHGGRIECHHCRVRQECCAVAGDWFMMEMLPVYMRSCCFLTAAPPPCSESPQWRRGPQDKPILCNACGTRFRRTGQLGPAVPSQVGLAATRAHLALLPNLPPPCSPLGSACTTKADTSRTFLLPQRAPTSAKRGGGTSCARDASKAGIGSSLKQARMAAVA